MQFSIYQTSRQGPREYNQDRVAYAYSKDALLAVLADGMGGHLHGEVAADHAIKVLTEAFLRMALPTLGDPARFLRQHIRQAHDSILHHALETGMPESPCTTLVAALVQRDTLYCAHAGDSRLYHFRRGELLFRTDDHSKVQMLFEQGLIRREEMLTHPQRNLVYNCVGGDAPPHPALAPAHPVVDGDVILLCSDGLWSLVSDEEMAPLLCSGAVKDSVPALFALAESRADLSGDNMSAIAIQWGAGAGTAHTISTASMSLDSNAVVHNLGAPSPRASVSDEASLDAIEYAIAEIQMALKKSGG